MKAHILTVLVIDHDKLGASEAREVLENARYPNHCIRPDVQATETFDVGEWDDEHPLNQRSTDAIAWLREHGVKERQ